MKKLLFLLMIVFIMTGCGLNVSKVDERYVKSKIEKKLRDYYGTEFIVNIVSFDKNSNVKKSVAEVYPKVDPSLKFDVTGQIKCFFITYYYLMWDFNIFDKINNELCSKYSFEIGHNADYNLVADNVRNYLKEFRILINDYKNGERFKKYFDEKYERAEIPFTINGQRLQYINQEEIIIDRSNGKVVVDTNVDNWVGEMELEEYLRLLSTKPTK